MLSRAAILLTIFFCTGLAGPVSANTPPCTLSSSQEVELISKSREGEAISIVAHLINPVGNGPFPALVLLHGMPGGLQPRYLCIAEKMVAWGYAALVIDSNSSPLRNRGRSIGSYLDIEQAQDAHQGRIWLAAKHYVDGKRIGVVGWSKGSSAALAAISNHWFKYNGKSDGVDKEGPFDAAVGIYPSCFDQIEDLSTLLLLLIGAKDSTVSARYCQEMLRKTSSTHDVELKVYPDAGHGFDGPWSGWSRKGSAASASKSRIREFLAKHLN
mgnify:CR=1 FL=1